MRRFYKIVKNKKILKKNKNLKRILFRCNNKQIYKYSFKIKKKKEKRYYRRFYIPVYRNPYQLKDVRSLLKKFKENKKFSLINFFKLYYNFSTKNQLFRFVKNCKSTVKFFKRFEHRYDVLLYRLNFTNSFYESKLLIKNGYFCLNNQVMTNYRLSLNKLDIVSPSNNFFVCIYNQLLIKFLYYSKCL